MSKELGAIYTPEGYARILANWAIHSDTDFVLDMGIGPGIFVYQAYDRLLNLGASSGAAENQIFGSEIEKKVFDGFSEEASKRGLTFRNLQNANFFDLTLPQVDAVVGNPPYVRRRGMQKETLDLARTKTLAANPKLEKSDVSNLSDLYIYFLLFALPNLKPGGRLATILADTWLSTRYGAAFRNYLKNDFVIDQIVSLDRSVFEDAQVKAVILFATKRSEERQNYSIKLSRVRNGLPISQLSAFLLQGKVRVSGDIVVKTIESDKLDPTSSWGGILKSTTFFETICKKDFIKPLGHVADLHIGVETLAKDFFVFSRKQKEDGIVEEKYLVPFAYSVYDFEATVIDDSTSPDQYIFCCSEQKESLANTKALKHILDGETKEVSVRGTGRTVIGYQNKERIQKANRPYWYDIKTECDKKPISEILLPRFIYKRYFVLWNRSGYVPGGAVVQFFPRKDLFLTPMDTRVYLAILTSAFTEIALRINAQVYGGGTSNLLVTAIKDSPTIDATALSPKQREDLIAAYDTYLESGDASKINRVVFGILALTESQIAEMNSLLDDLKEISASARKAAHPTD